MCTVEPACHVACMGDYGGGATTVCRVSVNVDVATIPTHEHQHPPDQDHDHCHTQCLCEVEDHSSEDSDSTVPLNLDDVLDAIARGRRPPDVWETISATYRASDAQKDLLWMPDFAAAGTMKTLRGRKPVILPDLPPCLICMDPVDPNGTGIWSCGETGAMCCADCLVQYMSAQLDTHDVMPLKCPEYGCSCVIQQNRVRAYLATHTPLLKKYNRILDLRKNPDRRECPKCDHRQDGDPAKPIMECEKCKQEYCYHHGLAHIGQPCSAVKKQPRYKKMKTSMWKMLHTKHCPKCKSSIQKNGGCPHMTCRKCQHQWCWDCGKDWRYTNKGGRTLYHCADAIEGLNPRNWGRRCRSVKSLALSTLVVALAPAAIGCVAALYGPYALIDHALEKRKRAGRLRRQRRRNARAAAVFRTQLERERETIPQQSPPPPLTATPIPPRQTVLAPTTADGDSDDAATVRIARFLPELTGVYCVMPDGTRGPSLRVQVQPDLAGVGGTSRTLAATQRFLASTAVETTDGVQRLYIDDVGWVTLDERVERVGSAPHERYVGCDYFHGDVSRVDAAKILTESDAGDGAYMVRRGPNTRGIDNHIGVVYISVLRVTPTQKRRVRHYQIRVNLDGGVKLTMNGRVFASMEELLAAGKEPGLFSPSGLGFPAPKSYGTMPWLWY